MTGARDWSSLGRRTSSTSFLKTSGSGSLKELVAKANFAKLCLVNAQPMTRSRFEQLVLQSLTMISPTKVNNIYTHNRKHIAKML